MAGRAVATPWPSMCAPSKAATLETSRVTIVVDGEALGLGEELDLRELLEWLDSVLDADFTDTGTLTLRLQADAGIADLNRRFRERCSATDVLSFPGGSTDPESYFGDIAISLETAARQAAEEGHSLATEVRLLALHGILHCLGYDHETDSGEMVRAELDLRDRWLADIGDE